MYEEEGEDGVEKTIVFPRWSPVSVSLVYAQVLPHHRSSSIVRTRV